jgi:hypothetical protein
MNIQRSVLYLGLLLVAIGLAGCNENDPASGGTYGYLAWTSDIVAADFTEIGVPSPFYSNTRYSLRVGSATVYWASNYTGSTTYWYLPVNVEAGTSNMDRRYTGLLSSNTLYFTDELLPIGTASVSGVTTSGLGPEIAMPAIDAPYQPGRLGTW